MKKKNFKKMKDQLKLFLIAVQKCKMIRLKLVLNVMFIASV